MKAVILFFLFIVSAIASSNYDDAYELYKKGDLEGAYKGFRQICAQNNFTACFSAGNILNELKQKTQNDKNISKKNKEKIMDAQNAEMLSLFQKSCNGGYGAACNNLAYFRSQIPVKKPAKDSNPLPLYLTQDYNADDENQDNLNVLEAYKNEDIINAYKKACDNGISQACNNLGIIYSNSMYGANNQNASIDYYIKSCNNKDENSAVSCFNLGNVYYNSNDFYNAFKNFSQACDLNNKDACLNLAIMYEKGQVGQIQNSDNGGATGVQNNLQTNAPSDESNYSNAMQYYAKSCGLREKKACEYLESLSNRMKKAKYK